MKTNRISGLRLAGALFLSMQLLGCSGGGDKEEERKELSYNDIISAAKDYSEAQLVEAFDEKLSVDYQGKTDSAEMDFSRALELYKLAIDSDTLRLVGVSLYDLEDYLGQSNWNQSLDCSHSGSVRVSGELKSNSERHVDLNYSNCTHSYRYKNVNGKEIIKVEESTNSRTAYTTFLNGVKFTFDDNDQDYSLSGYIQSEGVDAGELRFTENRNLILTNLSDNTQVMVESTTIYTYNYDTGNTIVENGTVTHSELGHVSFSANHGYDYSTGDFHDVDINGASNFKFLLVEGGYLKILHDVDNDGEFDEGTYLRNLWQLSSAQPELINLVPVAEMSLPPYIGYPQSNQYSYTTKDPITVYPSYVEDPDTDENLLTYSYLWYINDVLVETETTNTFPAYLAVFGDEVTVKIVVSDGVNSTVSDPLSINIEDSPAEISIGDIPEPITAGTLITFTAHIYDPDLNTNEDIPANLASGPEDASIDANGLVTWQVPQNMFFEEQRYQFTFTNPSNEEEQIIETLSVVGSGSKLVARSGAHAPGYNNSIWVGDFNGDGKQAILSTDSMDRIFIVEHTAAGLSQSWMYPYSLADEGNILQVFGMDVDNDGVDEVIVVHSNGLYLIEDIQKPATLIVQEEYIYIAAAADSNLDGHIEIAYITSDSDYYSENKKLKVISLNEPNNELVSLELGDVSDLTFANVDEDPALELITNTGQVYDGADWTNQWFRGSSFGQYYVTAGDLDGDGIEEIIGADNWGDVKVFDVQNRAQLYVFDNFNTCTIHVANIDSDPEDELLVGDCQWGDVTAYDWSENQLISKWSINSQGHGTQSIAVGDSDNNGMLNVLWGSDQQVIVGDLISTGIELSFSDKAINFESYYSAGWAGDEGVFFIPRSDNGGHGDQSGSRVLTMSESGAFTFSDVISKNWDNSVHAAVTDFNNDGENDIFLPTTNFYDGSIGVLQLSDFSEHWTVEDSSSSTIGKIKPFDLNQDSYADLIYAAEDRLVGLDIENQLMLGSISFDYNISDFTSTVVDDTVITVVATRGGLTLLKKGQASFSELHYHEQICNRLEFGNFDEDAALELVCLGDADSYNYDSKKLVIFDIESDMLVVAKSNSIDYLAVDIAVDTSTLNNQNLFITKVESDYGYWDNNSMEVAYISNNGQLIWMSKKMIGYPNQSSLKFMKTETKSKLMFSSNMAMFMATKTN